METSPNSFAKNLIQILVGTLFIFCFFSLGVTHQGLGVAFTGPTGYEPTQELNFWLGAGYFLAPGFFILLLPFRDVLIRWWQRVGNALVEMPVREKKLGAFILFALVFVSARLGHYFILHDFPITDDEWGAKFGGQVLAAGHFMSPIWEPFKSYMHPFMFVEGGKFTSFELPGIGAVWALGEWLGDSAIGWSVVAAVPMIPILCIAKKFMSERWAFLAAMLYLFSPQALTLSLTTHSHLLPRALVSLALLFYVRSLTEVPKLRDSLLFGLVTGVGYLSRPYEFGAILLPFQLIFVYDAIREPKRNAQYLGSFIVGLLIPALFFAYYNLETTGRILFFTRLRPAYMDFDFPAYANFRKHLQEPTHISTELIWSRFGSNFTNNLLGVWAWFYAPVGFISVMFGIATSRFAKTLAAGLLSCFVLSLFHDNYGIHLVGPINYSECVPILALLAAFGARRIFLFCENNRLNLQASLATLLTASIASSFIFTGVNWFALNKQGSIHQSIYGFVESNIDRYWGQRLDRQAVVLADQYAKFWWAFPEMRRVGSYVYDWRIPAPDQSDKVIFLRDDPSTLNQILVHFKGRDFFRMKVLDRPPYINLYLVDPITGASKN